MQSTLNLRLAAAFAAAGCLVAAALLIIAFARLDLRSDLATLPGLSRFEFFRDAGRREAMIPDIFTYQQQRSLSCEYASLHIATSLLGDPISEYAFDAVVPRHENPHLGYRGDINGTWGNTDDYGVYAAPLARALNHFGFTGHAFFGERGGLEAQLDQGRPVVVWLGMWGGAGSFDAFAADGARYQLTPGMHVMVAYGYDDDGVYLTDPGIAQLRFYEWDTYLSLWNVMDGMALSVHR